MSPALNTNGIFSQKFQYNLNTVVYLLVTEDFCHVTFGLDYLFVVEWRPCTGVYFHSKESVYVCDYSLRRVTFMYLLNFIHSKVWKFFPEPDGKKPSPPEILVKCAF